MPAAIAATAPADAGASQMARPGSSSAAIPIAGASAAAAPAPTAAARLHADATSDRATYVATRMSSNAAVTPRSVHVSFHATSGSAHGAATSEVATPTRPAHIMIARSGERGATTAAAPTTAAAQPAEPDTRRGLGVDRVPE